jgi:hypothetical protein
MTHNVAQSRTRQALSLFEARERIAGTTFLPDDEARPDGWPEWRRDFPAPAELSAAAGGSAPPRIRFQAGLTLAAALALAVAIAWLLPG